MRIVAVSGWVAMRKAAGPHAFGSLHDRLKKGGTSYASSCIQIPRVVSVRRTRDTRLAAH